LQLLFKRDHLRLVSLLDQAHSSRKIILRDVVLLLRLLFVFGLFSLLGRLFDVFQDVTFGVEKLGCQLFELRLYLGLTSLFEFIENFAIENTCAHGRQRALEVGDHCLRWCQVRRPATSWSSLT